MRARSKTRLWRHSKVHRFVEPMAGDELMRNCRAATANAFVGLLKSDDVGVDFLKHSKPTRCGSRLPSRPTALCIL